MKNYHNSIYEFKESLNNTVMIDTDLSEKLQFPTKFQAQSQHWNEKTVIVHSGIMKQNSVRSYHAILLDDTFQDQAFVTVFYEKYQINVSFN